MLNIFQISNIHIDTIINSIVDIDFIIQVIWIIMYTNDFILWTHFVHYHNYLI
jgi:hypothetical protein